MATLPPKSSTRSSSQGQAQDESAQSSASQDTTRSTPSSASSTIILNEPASLGSNKGFSQTETQAPPAPSRDVRNCWICLQDETDDNQPLSAWRTPCPCALTAHESCLLDWISDLQNPPKRKKTPPVRVIHCPQCKAEIKVKQRYSAIMNAVARAEKYISMAIVPGLLLTVVGGVWTACLCYGMNTIYVIYGDATANSILRNAQLDPYPGMRIIDPVLRALAPFAPVTHLKWRAYLGLPLIPAVLIMSRTSYADVLLPVLPLAFFIHPGNEIGTMDLMAWPPSSAVVFSILPYFRSAYNGIYQYAFGDLLLDWHKAMRPRLEEGDSASEENAEQNQDNREPGDADIVIDAHLNADGGIDIDFLVDEAPERNEEEVVEAFADVIHALEEEQGPGAVNEENVRMAAGQVQQQVQNQQQQAQNGNEMREYVVANEYTGRRALGALLFPSVAAAMGMLLRLSLPKHWTSKADRTPAKYLLQKQWGRTIVGGCLFIVLKDALTLIYKWQRVRAFQTRRVVDYKGKRAKGGVRMQGGPTSTRDA